MDTIFFLIFICFLLSPIFIVIHIYRRLSALQNRIEENFAADQADKHVMRRALERMGQLEETVQRLSAASLASGVRTPATALKTSSPTPAVETIGAFPTLPSKHPDIAPESATASPLPSGEPVRADNLGSKTVQPATAPTELAFLPPIPDPVIPPTRVSTPGPIPSGATGSRPTAAPEAPRVEWEALIGGNLLNKLGAFILVIGLGLFLYYTIDSFGPAAKLFIGILLGGGLLLASAAAERWGQDPLFIRGLFGAGWSSLYFTAYAAHGLTATRVIDSPLVAGALLLIVAAGMVAHSLRFASESTTGLAFLIAFVGMVIGPTGSFTNFASMLLIAGLLFLAHRFAWSHLALVGTFLGYGFYLFHPATGIGEGLAAQATSTLPVVNNLLLCLYWWGFEAMAIATAHRHQVSGQVRGAQFLANALGFFFVSYALRPVPSQGHEFVLWGELTAFYLLSGYARYSLFPARTDPDSQEEPWAGNAESALCAAGVAGLLLVWNLLPATLVAIGWGILGLLVIEIGLRYPFATLRRLGHLAAVLAFGRVFMANLAIDGHTAGVSHRLLTVMPMIVLYIQLFLRCAEDSSTEAVTETQRLLTRVYLYFPVILLIALVRFELGRGLTTPAWALIALALQFIGNHWKLTDLRRQSVVLGVLTAMHGWGTDLRSLEASGWLSGSIFIGSLTIMVLYACQAITPREPPGREHEFEGAPTGVGNFLENSGRLIFSLTGSFLLAFLLYLEITGSLLSMAWAFQGGLLLVLGFALREKPARQAGLVLLLLCLVKLFFHDLQNLEVPFRILSFVVLGLLLIAVSWFYTRYQDKIREYL